MISVVIPCYNHFEMTCRCIDAYIQNTPLDYITETFIYDDCSTDETSQIEDLLKDKLDIIKGRVIRATKQRGGVIGLNKTIPIAKGKYYCIIENDVIVGKNWIPPILNAFKDNPEYGLFFSYSVVPSQVSYDDWNIWQQQEYHPHYLTPWEKGHPYTFKTNVFNDIGLWDEQFLPTQYEDWDIQLRLAYGGYKYGRVMDSLSYHFARTTQTDVLKVDPDYPRRNRGKFAKKWGESAVSILSSGEALEKIFNENKKDCYQT